MLLLLLLQLPHINYVGCVGIRTQEIDIILLSCGMETTRYLKKKRRKKVHSVGKVDSVIALKNGLT